ATFSGRIAPAAAGHTPLSFRLQDADREATRTLRVTSWPRWTVLGWLTPLVTLDEVVDVSLHVAPEDPRKALKGLGWRLALLQASRIKNAETGRPDDADTEAAVFDLQRTQATLGAPGEKLWDAGLYVHLRAGGDHAERALGTAKEGMQARVEAAVARTFAEAHVAAYQQPEGFQAIEPLGADPLKTTHALDTRTVARALPFCVGTESGRGILLGVDRVAHGPVLHDAFDPHAFNSNLAVVAPSGSGKSYALKALAARHRYLGADVWVIDPEREFTRLCRAQGGQVVVLASSGGSRINPLDLPPPDTDEATGAVLDPVRERAADVAALVETMLTGGTAPLSTAERGQVDTAVLAAYAGAGILPDQPETWAREAPLLADVQARLATAAPELAERLEPFTRGLYAGPFAGPTDVDLAAPFVVFDVSRTDDRLRPVVVHALTAHVWRQVRRQRKPRLLVVDEAASVLRTPEGAKFLQEMARRARKYWLGLCVAVQELRHLDDSPAGRDVLTNAGTQLILGHEASKLAPVVAAFGLSEAERADLLAADKGEGLLLGRASRRFVAVTASPAEHALFTTAPSEVRRIEAEAREAQKV
ncbi:MAG: VirB4 family type IV secretion system protein, partial [Chloroflexota bacterium]